MSVSLKDEVIYFKKLLSFIVTLKKKSLLLFPFPSTNLAARDKVLLLCCFTSHCFIL